MLPIRLVYFLFWFCWKRFKGILQISYLYLKNAYTGYLLEQFWIFLLIISIGNASISSLFILRLSQNLNIKGSRRKIQIPSPMSMIPYLMYTSVTWPSIDAFVVAISRTPGFSELDNSESEPKFGYRTFNYYIIANDQNLDSPPPPPPCSYLLN